MGNRLNGESEWRRERDIAIPNQIFQHDCGIRKEEHSDGMDTITCDDEKYLRLEGGEQRWIKDGKIHRDDDLPALITPEGDMFWYQRGQLHREGDKPAAVFRSGRRDYYRHGRQYKSLMPVYNEVKESLGYYNRK